MYYNPVLFTISFSTTQVHCQVSPELKLYYIVQLCKTLLLFFVEQGNRIVFPCTCILGVKSCFVISSNMLSADTKVLEQNKEYSLLSSTANMKGCVQGCVQV